MPHMSPPLSIPSEDEQWRDEHQQASRQRLVLLCRPAVPETYRYLLRVRICAGSGPHLAIIGKNPSQADAVRADPTTGKAEAWARRQGFSTLTYVNLFAYRSPYPKTLNALEPAQAVGPDNDASICEAVRAATAVVAAWGNPNGIDRVRYDGRIRVVLALIRDVSNSGQGRDLSCLFVVGHLTDQGYPRHPLHWNLEPALRSWLAATS